MIGMAFHCISHNYRVIVNCVLVFLGLCVCCVCVCSPMAFLSVARAQRSSPSKLSIKLNCRLNEWHTSDSFVFSQSLASSFRIRGILLGTDQVVSGVMTCQFIVRANVMCIFKKCLAHIHHVPNSRKAKNKHTNRSKYIYIAQKRKSYNPMRERARIPFSVTKL